MEYWLDGLMESLFQEGRGSGYLLGPDGENWKVVPLGDIKNDLFLSAFICKICCELLAQEPSVRPYNAVFAGVITRMPMKYVDPDLLLCRLSRYFPNCTFGYVKQKLLQAKRSL